MKSKLLFIGGLLFYFSYQIIFHTTIFAHPNVLDVAYDAYQSTQDQEEENELWYLLHRSHIEYDEYLHLSEDTTIIRYYFSDYAKNDLDYTWTTDVSEEIATEIRNAFIKSLCKWNDVVYYTYDQNGNRIKRQLITIEEGTKDNYNLLIYPIGATAPYVASTAPLGEGIRIDTHTSLLRHIHYEKWYMNVNLHYFYQNQDVSSQEAFIHKERTGMHELGHVLGLRDIDAYCSFNQHHEGLLMGYRNGLNCQLGATYQDIAGVAITRGYHTDEDHIWMKRVNKDDTVDLICAICNGIIYDVKTVENNIINYQSCKHYGGNFTHMLLVASFGQIDFFKCQGCRHIETIEFAENYYINKDNIRVKDARIINALSKIYYKLNVEMFQYYQIIASSYETLHITLYNENLEIIEPQVKKESNIIKDRRYALSEGVYYIEIENTKSNKDMLTLDICIKNPIYLVFDYAINGLLSLYNNRYQNNSRIDQLVLSEKEQDNSSYFIRTMHSTTIFSHLIIPNEMSKKVKVVDKKKLFITCETMLMILEDKKFLILH
ncbi:MAG: hypothetical protein NC182_07095 [Prevotella sp.]|nr:hypothetical protein [Staphylococcus sp.]MCM1350947.1 hypothetical protein [Prevotella sp.]